MNEKDAIKLLKAYCNYCKNKYQQHYEAARYYKSLYRKMTIPVLFLSSLITIISTYSVTTIDEYIKWINLIVSFFLTFTQSVLTFLEYNEQSNQHNITYNSYNILHRTIETYISYINDNDYHVVNEIDVDVDIELKDLSNNNDYKEENINNIFLRNNMTKKEMIKSMIILIFKEIASIEKAEPLLPYHIRKKQIFLI